MKRLKQFGKISLVSIGVTCFAALLGLTLFVTSGIPQQLVKEVLEQELSKVFPVDIQIGKVSGGLLRSINIHNVKFIKHSNFSGIPVLEIKQGRINYNIIKALRNGGDFAAATRVIRASGVTLNVIRNEAGEWSALYLIPKGPNLDDVIKEPAFTGMFKIEDMTICFQDEKGWGAAKIENTFTQDLHVANGRVDFSHPEQSEISLQTTSKLGTPLNVFGELNARVGTYNITFASELNLTDWSSYVFPNDAYVFVDGDIPVTANIISKFPHPDGKLPFWYHIEVGAKNADLTFPFIDAETTNVKGSLKLIHGIIHEADLYSILPAPTSPDEILTRLKASNIVDESGHIKRQLILDESLVDYQQYPILEYIADPPHYLLFENVSGEIAGTPLFLDGWLNLSKGALLFNLTAQPDDLNSISQLFKPLNSLDLSGQGVSKVSISGPYEDIKILGFLFSPNAKVYGIPVEDVVTFLSLSKGELVVDLLQGQIASGNALAHMNFDFNQETPGVSVSANVSGMILKKLFPSQKKWVTGNVTVSTQLYGNVEHLYGFGEIVPENLTIANQEINGINVNYQVIQNSNILFDDISMSVNEPSPNVFSVGYISLQDRLEMDWMMNDVPLKEWWSQASKNMQATQLNGILDVAVSLNTFTVEAVRKSIIVSADMSVDNLYVSNNYVGNVETNWVYNGENENFYLHSLVAENNAANLDVNGEWEAGEIRAVKATANHIILSSIGQFKALLPKSIKLFDGEFSGRLDYKKPPNSSATIIGDFQVLQGVIQNQPFDLLSGDIVWSDQLIELKKGVFDFEESHLEASGHFESITSFNLTVFQGSKIAMKNLALWTAPLGNLEGLLAVHGQVNRNSKIPDFDLNIKVADFNSKLLQVDELLGHVQLNNKQLKVHPLTIKQKGSLFSISGDVDLSDVLDSKFKWYETPYDLSLKLEKTDLAILTRFVEDLIDELQARSSNNQELLDNFLNINTAAKSSRLAEGIGDPQDSESIKVLYGTDDATLTYVEALEKERTIKVAEKEIVLEYPLKGKLSGYLSSEYKRNGRHQLNSEIIIKDISVSIFNADELVFDAKTNSDIIRLSLALKDGNIGLEKFDEINSLVTYDKSGNLNIVKTLVASSRGNEQNIISGWYPLSAHWNAENINNKMSLQLNLLGNQVDLLSLFTNQIKSISNEGNINISLTGPIYAPQFSSQEISLKSMEILLNTEILGQKKLTLDAENIALKNNQLKFSNLQITMPRYDKPQLKNSVVFDGQLELEGLSALRPRMVTLNTNLKMQDARLVVDIPNIYSGKLFAKNGSLTGPLLIPASLVAIKDYQNRIKNNTEIGPVLKGDFSLFEGDIKVESKTKAQETFLLSVLLDVNATFQRDVAVVGGVLGNNIVSGLANYFDVSILPQKSAINVSGTLNSPKVAGQLQFEEGSFSILSRSFDLLTLQQQELFFRQEQYNSMQNEIRFQTRIGPSGNRVIDPQLYLSALSVTEPLVLSTVNIGLNELNSYTGVLINFRGSVFSLSNLSMDRYLLSNADPRSSEIQFVSRFRLQDANQLDTQGSQASLELARLLIPEFAVDSQNSDENDPNQAQRFFSTYGENQINTLVRRRFLRPIEKDLAKQIGLYDIRVDYNVGKALLNAPDNSAEVQDDSVGINFVHQLIDRKLFLRLKTDLDVSGSRDEERADSVLLSEIELQYFLFRELSLTFSNTRDNNIDRPRFSLRYGFDF